MRMSRKHSPVALDSGCSQKSSFQSISESRSTSILPDSMDVEDSSSSASSGCPRSFPLPDFPPGRWGCLLARPPEIMLGRSGGTRTALSSGTHPCSFKPKHYHASPVGSTCDFGIDEYVSNLIVDDSENDTATTIAAPATSEPAPKLEDGTNAEM